MILFLNMIKELLRELKLELKIIIINIQFVHKMLILIKKNY